MSNELTPVEIEQTKYEDTLGLIGRKITDIRWLTKSESGGWFCQPIMITLDDGTQLIPQSDDEGNDMQEIKNDKQALVLALKLAIVADSKANSDKALKHAINISQSMSEQEIDECKAIALAEIKTGDVPC